MTLPIGSSVAPATPERTSRIVTLLGVRFLDLAIGLPVTGGLVAFAQSLTVPAPAVRGTPNPSGTFGFHELPGMRALERPGELPPLGSPPRPTPFAVMVADTRDRFLPALFTVDVPFVAPPGSPPEGLLPLPVLDTPLFSAPTRGVPSGFTAVRAELWDRELDAPVTNALVRVTVGDRKCLGISGAGGQLLVTCPAPLSDRLRLGSPPGKATTPKAQTWPVTLEVYSSLALPHAPVLPRGAPPLVEPWSALPPLRAVLDGQPRAKVWARAGGPAAQSWTGELTYGRDLVVRTTSLSRLWISRGASPP
jgi:hypothetical protein